MRKRKSPLHDLVHASILTALACCCVAAPLRAEPFIGQFELKTLDSEPGSYEFQSQNAWSWGQPQRRATVGPEGLLLDENAVIRARNALELEIGLTRSFKMRIGVEFEQERLDDPPSLAEANDFDDLPLSEIGAEIIAIVAPREGDGGGLGFVAEIEAPTDGDEPTKLVLGPIVELQSGRWFAAAIPMAVYAFGGEADEGSEVDNKWDFAYAAQLKYSFSHSWMLALEAYGTVERIGNSGSPSPAAVAFGDFNQHRIGPVLYYEQALAWRAASSSASDDAEDAEEGPSLRIGLGMLEGLNGNTPDHTLKLSLEIQF